MILVYANRNNLFIRGDYTSFGKALFVRAPVKDGAFTVSQGVPVVNKAAAIIEFFNPKFFKALTDALFVALFFSGKHNIRKDTKDECTGSCSNFHLTERYRHIANACNKDNGGNKKVSVFVEVDLLEHFKAGYRNEAVKSETNASHDTCGDRLKKCYEGANKGENDAGSSSGPNTDGGGIACDCHTCDRLPICSVRTTTEKCSNNGTEAITEKRPAKTGFFQKIYVDNGGEILVIGKVFGKYDECYRNIRSEECDKIRTGNLRKSIFSKHESKVRQFKDLTSLKCTVINHNKGCVTGCSPNEIKYGSKSITGENTDNKRDQSADFFAVSRAKHCYSKGNKTADKGNIDTAVLGAGTCQTADSASCERKSNSCNCWANDDRGHKLADPLNSAELNNYGNNNIHKACHGSTNNKAYITNGHGCRSGNRRDH